MEKLKRFARKIFNSCAAQAQEDLHESIRTSRRLLLLESRRNHLLNSILRETQCGTTTQKYTDHDIIVSLTSYGKRIHEVSLAIESLMQQTMKPNRIVLWLDRSYENRPLPQSLLLQQRRGLEIAFCEDLRSYKKLIPQMSHTPGDAIITADDDILYDYDVLEHLISSYLTAPNMIHCCRVHLMKMNPEGRLYPYCQWDKTYPVIGTNRLYFITGGAGALYPPNSLDADVFDQTSFLNLCPNADDVWFTAMALKKGTRINKVYTRHENGEDYLENLYLKGKDTLAYLNITLNDNDRQINAVFSKYSLYDKLVE